MDASTPVPKDDYYDAIERFVGSGAARYRRTFRRLEEPGWRPLVNLGAALGGTIWFGARRLWAWALIASLFELFAIGRICKGLFSDLGAPATAKAERLIARSEARRADGEAALEAGADNAEALLRSADNLALLASQARAEAEAAAAEGTEIAVTALIVLLVVKLVIGLSADAILLRRYRRWRNARAGGAVLSLAAGLATAVGFALALLATGWAMSDVAATAWLQRFPEVAALRSDGAAALDRFFEVLTGEGGWLFDAVTWSIRTLIDLIERALLAPPWPVTMLFIALLAWLTSGARVAILAMVAFAYLGLFGYWEQSLRTVALLGAAALIAIAIGIPTGVLCARKPAVYAVIRPILDFMQTMPAFVYLIPVIALFGIGKPPGVIATLFFGMPPVIRLTALGLQNVPEDVREAARAFGASETRLLLTVDLPLAAPSIMTGVNQTILMSLGMVVIASLIGAKGLGEEVLQALQFAATGSGILAGLAILFCAMVLDRIVQGRGRRDKK